MQLENSVALIIQLPSREEVMVSWTSLQNTVNSQSELEQSHQTQRL